MRLFKAALDTPLDSPFSATLSVHGLHFTVCALSSICSCYCCRGAGKQLQAQKEEIINLTQKRLKRDFFPLFAKRLKVTKK